MLPSHVEEDTYAWGREWVGAAGLCLVAFLAGAMSMLVYLRG